MPKKSEAISEATALGIQFNPRWPKTRILSLIKKAHKTPEVKPSETSPPAEFNPVADILEDRMMRYGKNSVCPACGAHPIVITMKRNNYSAFRCRKCDNRWQHIFESKG